MLRLKSKTRKHTWDNVTVIYTPPQVLVHSAQTLHSPCRVHAESMQKPIASDLGLKPHFNSCRKLWTTQLSDEIMWPVWDIWPLDQMGLDIVAYLVGSLTVGSSLLPLSPLLSSPLSLSSLLLFIACTLIAGVGQQVTRGWWHGGLGAAVSSVNSLGTGWGCWAPVGVLVEVVVWVVVTWCGSATDKVVNWMLILVVPDDGCQLTE